MTCTENTSPRDVLAQRMPAFAQPYITWLSGIPHAGELQRFNMTPMVVITLGVLSILVGFGIIFGAMSMSMPWAALTYLLGFCFVAGGMRRLDVLIIHQSLHAKVLGSAKADLWLGEFLTTVLLRTPYRENQREHLAHHRSPCDDDDPDVDFLKGAGVTLASNQFTLFTRIGAICLSPLFHLGFTWSRIKANFFTAKPLYRAAMSWSYGAALVAPAAWYGTSYLQMLVMLWLIPLTVGFQISNFLYTTTKHRWWLFSNKTVRERTKRDLLSYARVCCSKMPEHDTTLARLGWWVKALFVHTPARLFIVVGDTVQHDLHHVAPTCDWPNSAAERLRHQHKTPQRFTEVWGGMFAHICECNLTSSIVTTLGGQPANTLSLRPQTRPANPTYAARGLTSRPGWHA